MLVGAAEGEEEMEGGMVNSSSPSDLDLDSKFPTLIWAPRFRFRVNSWNRIRSTVPKEPQLE